MPMPAPLLLSSVRLVRPGVRAGDPEPVDVLLQDGNIRSIRPHRSGSARGAHDDDAGPVEVIDAAGRWLAPGLWDQHVHFTQWARTAARVDLTAAKDPDAVLATLAAAIASTHRGTGPVQGFGYRVAGWDRIPSVAELDAVTGDRLVVLVSGDAHNGWLNSEARRFFGLDPATGGGLLDESDWWPVFARLDELPGTDAASTRSALSAVVQQANALGIVGIVDLELGNTLDTWPQRVAEGVDTLRVRQGFYPATIGAVRAAGLRSGDPLGPGALVEVGPLKVITDGSLGTRTAFCEQPYPTGLAPAGHPHGKQNYPPAQLTEVLTEGARMGMTAAVHAIGDAALRDALIAIEASGITRRRVSIEHAQLVNPATLATMARLGVVASVQPAHLIDDRDLTSRCWPGRAGDCFALAAMLAAGIELALGSDAPVARLDPWLAIDAAVRRTGDERPAWHGEQAISRAEAFAASTDGVRSVEVGGPADLILLDRDPLLEPARAGSGAREPGVAATLVSGRVVHASL